MSEERNTENAEGKIEELTGTPENVEEAKGLPLREALEVAIEASKPDTAPSKESAKSDDSGTRASVQDKASDGRKVPATSNADANLSPFEPPAEYSAKERADFLRLPRESQEIQLRLDKSRKTRIDEIKAAAREYQEIKGLADTLTPYLKAVGVKQPTEVALKKAVQMWQEFETGDPYQAAAAYLKAKGVNVPAELLKQESEGDEKIKPLQNELNEIKQKIASAEQAQASTILQNVWSEFETTKNAGGDTKYPDINNTESGLRLSSSIGSLVRGDTELSKQFITNVQARIPNLTYPALLEEAYKYCGGKISEASTTRTQETQKSDIQRARRAASSVPGRGIASTASNGTKKFKSYREAASAALAALKAD